MDTSACDFSVSLKGVIDRCENDKARQGTARTEVHKRESEGRDFNLGVALARRAPFVHL